MDAAACIGCGACAATCKNSSAMLFVAAKVSQLALLPQGKIEAARRAKAMVAKMDELGMDRSEYEFYLDLRKYGSVPHGGFGIGIERMVTFVAGTKHIREAIPFPRMLHRIKP